MNAPIPRTEAAGPHLHGEAAIEAGEHSVVSLDLRRIAMILRRNWLVIVAVIAVALFAGVIVTMLQTPRYTAVARLQIDQTADRVLEQNSDVRPEFSVQDADRFLQTNVDVIGSRAVALRVARRLNLIGSKAFFDAMRARLPEPKAGVPPEQIMREATLELVLDNLSVDLPAKSRIVSVSFNSPDAALAARIANSFASEFISGNLQRKFDSSSYARTFLSEQLADAKAKLEISEKELNDYARSAQLIRTGESDADANGRSRPAQSVTTASLVQFNEAANVAKAERIALETKWRTIERGALLSNSDVLDNQAVQDLLQQRATATASLRQESAKHLDDHPTVRQLKANVAEIDGQLQTLARNIRQSAKERYDAALSRENELTAQVSQYKRAQLAEQERSVRFGILSREADTNRALYDGLLQRFKEVSAAAGLTTNNVSIIDEADQPVKPSSPKLLFNMLLALLIGTGLAGGLVLAREELDDAIRAPDEVETKLGLPVLGVIPLASSDLPVQEQLSMPRSSLSEAYSALRTAMLYSTREGLPRSIGITSSAAREGKSTTSYALAVSLARLGKRVVLVGADLRKPSLHRLVDQENGQGLADLLVADISVESVIRSTLQPNLNFIASGPQPPSPTELLGSPRMGAILHELESRFDVVIVDGPPVLGLADAPLLGSIVEATVFVVESNRGSRGLTKAALRRLRLANINLIGVVLTKFDAKKAGQYYAYYDYEYYSYGGGDEVDAGNGNGAGRGKRRGR